MKKKLIGLSVIIILAGIIMVLVKGFNVNLKYREHKVIKVTIGQDFDVKDIKNISKDVFGKEQTIVEKAGLYNDEVLIHVKDFSDEQLNQVVSKVNEKYGLELSTESNDDDKAKKVESYSLGRVTLMDVAKQYTWYLIVASVIVLVYYMIIFKKLGIVKVFVKSVGIVLLSELSFLGLIAIVRYPIDKIVVLVGIALYVAVATGLNKMFKKELNVSEK